jgi:hypothetical protein
MESVEFLDQKFLDQYIVSFYNAILMLMGNDVYPIGMQLFTVSSILLVSGALVNA